MGVPTDRDGDDADKFVCTCAIACSEDAPNGDCPVCRENPADCTGKPAVENDLAVMYSPDEQIITLYYHSNWPEHEVERQDIWEAGEIIFVFHVSNVFYGEALPIHAFVGWNTKPDGSGRYYDDEDRIYLKEYGNFMPVELHLYAQWNVEPEPEPEVYHVVFDLNGGQEGHGPLDVLSEGAQGSTLVERDYTDAVLAWGDMVWCVRDGYQFTGWCRDKEGNGKIYLDEDIVLWEETTTLYAQWTPIVSPESVTLHRNLSKNDDCTVVWDEPYVPWPDEISGFEITEEQADRFLFWTTERDGGQILGSWGEIPADLYAQWTKAEDGRFITYFFDAPYWGPNVDYQTFDLSSETALRTPEELGFDREGFLGWSAEVYFTPETNPDEEIPEWFTQRDLDQYRENPSVQGIGLTARWATGGHILYDGNGNTEGSVPMDPAFHSIDEDVTLPFPADLKKDGGVLTSWNTAADGSGKGYFPGGRGPRLSEDLTLYAQYAALVEPDSCRVTYDANGLGGTAPADPTVYRYGEGAVVLSPDGLVQGPGREFLLWNTQPDGQGLDYLPGGTLRVAGDVTLYAIWGRTYTLTYDANAAEYTGELPAPKKYLQGITAPVAGYTLHRDGWLQLGWSTEPDGGIIYGSRYGNDIVPVTEDTTLYAVWVSPLRVRYETGLPADDPDQARLEALLPTDEESYR